MRIGDSLARGSPSRGLGTVGTDGLAGGMVGNGVRGDGNVGDELVTGIDEAARGIGGAAARDDCVMRGGDFAR